MSNAKAVSTYGEELSVHHIEPYEDGGTHDRDNLVSLCKSCHRKVEAEQKT